MEVGNCLYFQEHNKEIAKNNCMASHDNDLKQPKRVAEYNIQNNVRNFTSNAVRRNSVWYGAVDCDGV